MGKVRDIGYQHAAELMLNGWSVNGWWVTRTHDQDAGTCVVAVFDCAGLVTERHVAANPPVDILLAVEYTARALVNYALRESSAPPPLRPGGLRPSYLPVQTIRSARLVSPHELRELTHPQPPSTCQDMIRPVLQAGRSPATCDGILTGRTPV